MIIIVSCKKSEINSISLKLDVEHKHRCQHCKMQHTCMGMLTHTHTRTHTHTHTYSQTHICTHTQKTRYHTHSWARTHARARAHTHTHTQAHIKKTKYKTHAWTHTPAHARMHIYIKKSWYNSYIFNKHTQMHLTQTMLDLCTLLCWYSSIPVMLMLPERRNIIHFSLFK